MNTELFAPALLAQLDKIGQLFVWRRKALRDSVLETLQAADRSHQVLMLDYQSTLARLEALTVKHDQLTEHQASTAAELSDTHQTLQRVHQSLTEALDQQQQDREQARVRFDNLSTRHAQLVQERNSIEAAREALEQDLHQTCLALQTEKNRADELTEDCLDFKTRLATLNLQHELLSARHESTVAELGKVQQTLEQSRVELHASGEALDLLQQAHTQELQQHAQLANEFQVLNQRHGDTWTRFQLISRLLAARPRDSAGLARFRDLLTNDYMTFADSESSLGAEAKAVKMLQSIEQELALLVGFPDVHERTIVGIVGGFSSGKSEFINSFIRDPEVRLPVGLQPVTAIPSYVLATDQRMIRGYSANGGHIELDVAFYKNISHAFINSFSFDLKSLMPFMCVGVQMAPEYFSNICFIDTPGYNPPATAAEHSQGDRGTAIQFAQQSEAIIWLIGLDANGTVPVSDLSFIQDIGVDQRSVYVVLTKADLRPDDDIEDIMDEVQEVLFSEGISVAGISAYSSTLRNEVAYRDVPLLEYFSRINQPGDARQHLEGRLLEVFTMYDDAIQADIDGIRAQKTAVNGLRLDCLEIGGTDVYGRMLEPIAKLDRKLDTGPQESWLKESRRLLEDFSTAVRMTAELQETQT